MRIEIVLLIILAVWLLALSVSFFLFSRFFRKLIKETKEHDLIKILTKILKVQGENSENIGKIVKDVKKLENEGELHVQKIGLVRFNPFREIGGDHSFSLAILNGQDSGVIVTCLHTRERTRVYMKDIKKGKSELELSEEEKKALAKVLK